MCMCKQVREARLDAWQGGWRENKAEVKLSVRRTLPPPPLRGVIAATGKPTTVMATAIEAVALQSMTSLPSSRVPIPRRLR